MLTLGIDTSTKTGSIGLVKDDVPISEFTLNIDLTHSERLMSSIDLLLENSGFKIEEIDLFAYSKGPGSFTGLRIGLSTIKGLAFAGDKKIVGVSSLNILASNLQFADYQVCVMMDARKEEVYWALYDCGVKGRLKQIKKESADSPEDLLKKVKRKTIFFGTGARLYEGLIKKKLKTKAHFAPKIMDLPRGINAAYLGLESFKRGKWDKIDTVIPNYMRKSQAEVNYRR